jgi:DNA-binding response OmpR family regulator
MPDRPKVILCVDDDPDILASLHVVLDAAGYRAVQAASAAEGKRLCAETRPDAILVDLMMEEIDSGINLVRDLRASGNEAPIYMLSSTGDYLQGAADVSALGITGVFQKPLDPAVLLAVLERRLNAPRA